MTTERDLNPQEYIKPVLTSLYYHPLSICVVTCSAAFRHVQTCSDMFRHVRVCCRSMLGCWDVSLEIGTMYCVMQEVSTRLLCSGGTALYILCSLVESPRGLAAAVRKK
jgi:hypothetical protein